MSWWGKIVGGAFGFMVGGPLGALLGAAIGHSFDRGLTGIEAGAGGAADPGEQERVQAAFFTATFSVMGHVAKADGRVSEREIGVAEAVMQQMRLNEAQRKVAIRLYRDGKSPDFDLDAVLEQFRRECQRRSSLIQFFIEIQLQSAHADGRMTPEEEAVLLHICRVLRFPEERFRLLERMLHGEYHAHQQWRQTGGDRGQRVPGRGGMALHDAYAILGVARNDDNDAIKRAYRKLMSQHHPDKLVARGLPDEMIEVAKEKSQDISRAYERIKEARGM